jgi:hypothetical protein
LQEPQPGAVPAPSHEAIIAGLVGTVPRGDVALARTGGETP